MFKFLLPCSAMPFSKHTMTTGAQCVLDLKSKKQNLLQFDRGFLDKALKPPDTP